MAPDLSLVLARNPDNWGVAWLAQHKLLVRRPDAPRALVRATIGWAIRDAELNQLGYRELRRPEGRKLYRTEIPFTDCPRDGLRVLQWMLYGEPEDAPEP